MCLDGVTISALIPSTSRPDGRCRDCGRLWPIKANPVEESPGSMETRWRLTAAGGDPRESATESKPPRLAGVRVKGCGKSAPLRRRRRRQGKPHREQDQIGVAGRARKRGARSVFRPATRVDCSRRSAMGVPDEWPSRRETSRQNPAYRPAGNFSFRFSGVTAAIGTFSGAARARVNHKNVLRQMPSRSARSQ